MKIAMIGTRGVPARYGGFETAVEEGATIVRVGRAIFGERPHDHEDGRGRHDHEGAH